MSEAGDAGRSRTVVEKVTLHLGKFRVFLGKAYRHDRISEVVRRVVQELQRSLVEQGLALSDVTTIWGPLSVCTTWVHAQALRLLAALCRMLHQPPRGRAARYVEDS